MTQMKKNQQKRLSDLEATVELKRADWLTAYEAAKATNTSTTLYTPSQLNTLYQDLVAVRQKRNDLLAHYRSLGINI